MINGVGWVGGGEEREAWRVQVDESYTPQAGPPDSRPKAAGRCMSLLS